MDYQVFVDQDLKVLIPGFMENRFEEIEELKGLVEEKDYEKIEDLGHAIKGTGGGYGFDLVTELGLEIEEAARAEDKEKIKELILKLEDFLENVEINYK